MGGTEESLDTSRGAGGVAGAKAFTTVGPFEVPVAAPGLELPVAREVRDWPLFMLSSPVPGPGESTCSDCIGGVVGELPNALAFGFICGKPVVTVTIAIPCGVPFRINFKTMAPLGCVIVASPTRASD